MLQESKSKRLVAALVVAVVLVVAIFAANRSGNTGLMNKAELIQQTRNEIVESGKRVQGTVVSVQGEGDNGTITIKTMLVDMNFFDQMTSDIGPESVEREVAVRLNKDTVFEGLVRGEVQEGMQISVMLDVSVYDGTSPIALKIERNDPQARIVKEVTHLEMIAATVAEMKGQTLIVEASIADEERLEDLGAHDGSFSVPYVAKRYVVTVTPSTEFLEGKMLEDIHFGTTLNIWGHENLYRVDAFDATKIYIQP